MLQTWLNTFLHDQKVHVALLLVAADLVFGVAAAFKEGNFRFSYVADFLRNDILQKLLPYFGIYVFALIAGGTSVVIPGLDFGLIAGAVYALVVAAWVASILGSIAVLFPGVAAKASAGKSKAATALFGSENAAPPKS